MVNAILSCDVLELLQPDFGHVLSRASIISQQNWFMGKLLPKDACLSAILIGAVHASEQDIA